MYKIFVFFCLIHVPVLCEIKDDTRTPGAYGQSVVDAVVQILHQKCLMSDHMFLQRMAKIATNYGENIDEQLGLNNGGIWKVDMQKFYEIMKHTKDLSQELATISSELGVDWSKVTWFDMDKPLFSALAAYLYLRSVTTEPVPESIKEQASFYNKYYDNSTTANRFYVAANNMHFNNCSDAPRDIAFVIDTSNGMLPADLVYARNFIMDVISSLPQGTDETRVSIVPYNTVAIALTHFNTHSDLKDQLAEVQKLTQITGSTNTGSALKFVAGEIFNIKRGMRLYSAKSVVLITNSKSVNKGDTVLQAATLKARGISVFVIGIGQDVDNNELEQVASEPTCINGHNLTSYSQLSFMKDEFTELICTVPEILHLGANVFPCDRISSILIPKSSIGQTIEVTVQHGDQAVYGSFVISRPNEAFHEISGVATPLQPLRLYIRNNSNLILKMDDTQKCAGNLTITSSIGHQDKSCNNQTNDVVFVLDSSSTVTDDEFRNMLQFVAHFSNGFDIGPHNMQISVVTYADTVTNQLWLNSQGTQRGLISAINKIQRQNGVRNTGKALEFVRDNSFLMNHGGRKDALQVVILLTNGPSANKTETIAAAQDLHRDGVRIITVGIGQKFDTQELNVIAPDFKHVFTVDGANALETIKSDVAKMSCGVVRILCIEAGIVRNCTSKEIEHSQHSKPVVQLPNICLSGLTIAPHPTDNTKYLTCDAKKQMLVVQCPANEIFCLTSQLCQTSCLFATPLTTTPTSVTSTKRMPITTQTTKLTTAPSITIQAQTTPNPSCYQNPCKHIGDYFPACKENEFIHCGAYGIGTLATCKTNKIWNQAIETCVNKYLLDTDNNKKPVTDYPNPCRGVTGDVYFRWPRDAHKYIHCDGYGDGFIISCEGSKIWHQDGTVCLI